MPTPHNIVTQKGKTRLWQNEGDDAGRMIGCYTAIGWVVCDADGDIVVSVRNAGKFSDGWDDFCSWLYCEHQIDLNEHWHPAACHN